MLWETDFGIGIGIEIEEGTISFQHKRLPNPVSNENRQFAIKFLVNFNNDSDSDPDTDTDTENNSNEK